jgi:hypothetical protein
MAGGFGMGTAADTTLAASETAARTTNWISRDDGIAQGSGIGDGLRL